jgi:hypothetical protein
MQRHIRGCARMQGTTDSHNWHNIQGQHMSERVRINRFDKMQNRVNVVGAIRGNENERYCHGKRERN